MPDKTEGIPAFASEAEEIVFWDTHDIADYDDGIAEDVVFEFRRPEPKQRVSLRLDRDLLADLKRVAAEQHIPYQTLARGLIRRGVAQLKHAS